MERGSVTLVRMDRPQSLSRAVSESIKDAILRGAFKPGDKLVESALTASLNVSRTPLREAFRELAAEGYLTLVPHRGAYVSRLTADEVRDIYTITSALEGLAVRLATPRMDEAALRQLKALHGELRRAHRARDIDLYYAANRTYHRFISQQSGNGRLVNMIEGLRRQILKTRVLSLSVQGRLDASMREHEEILDAVLARDARRA
ncbi:MAG: GntR family transcriptional regulator, partial [Nitrospinota bacterium]